MNFGLRYYAELRSKFKELFWRVEIAERGYQGSAERMAFSGASPLQITWEQRGDEFYVPVKGSEATVKVLCLENFRYINLFTSDPRRFRVSIYRNTKLYWRGYVVADLYSESFAAPPYEVSIKAVDGFSLLENIPFRNLDSTPLTGRKSLWSLISLCIDTLELEVDVADWLDLYAEGMSESLSPLLQTHLEMERMYELYEDVSYRDVLELCLKPFAAQIFQSNGALHIRRAISLYNDRRPLSFYSVGGDAPSGWLATADGRNLITASGDMIVTETSRERIESIWEEDINVQGDSVLDIAPPLRRVNVQVENLLQNNFITAIDIYNIGLWDNLDNALSLYDATTLRLSGDDSFVGGVVTHSGRDVDMSSATLKLSYNAKVVVSSHTTSSIKGAFECSVSLRLEGTEQTMWLATDGSWIGQEVWFTDMIENQGQVAREVEVKGFPMSGRLRFAVKQTMSGRGEVREYREMLYLSDFSMELSSTDGYDEWLESETVSNLANNLDMTIELPTSDVPYIPNDRLIYSLFLVDGEGQPTRMWHTRGRGDYATLVGHITRCAMRFRQLPARRITGEMFTGKHIDMNTVVQDDRYLGAGFYLNSIELDCLGDSYDVEIVEMPHLLQSEEPPEGDDCTEQAQLGFNVKRAVRCLNKIVMLTDEREIYTFDTVSKTLTRLFSFDKDVVLSPGDDSFVITDGESIRVVDYRGVVMRAYYTDYYGVASYMAGYIYSIKESFEDRETSLNYRSLHRPEYIYDRSTTGYSRTPFRYSFTNISSRVEEFLKSYSMVGINCEAGCYLHDNRVNFEMRLSTFEDGARLMSISDYFITLNIGGEYKIYRRDNLSEMTLHHTDTTAASYADATLTEVAYSQGGGVKVWDYGTGSVETLKNLAGVGSQIEGLLYIDGELYIIRNQRIFKHAKQWKL